MKKGMITLCYVDDCTSISDKKQMLVDLVFSLKNGIEKFEFTDEGLIDKYLGVEIEKLNGSEFILRQPYLIDRILSTRNVAEKGYNKRDVLVVRTLLGRDLDGAEKKSTIGAIDLQLVCLDIYKTAPVPTSQWLSINVLTSMQIQ